MHHASSTYAQSRASTSFYSLAIDVEFLAIVHISFAIDIVQPFVNVCLWHIFSCDDLANSFILLKDLHLLRTANTASKREDTTLTRVGTRRRVSDAKRAVDAMTVLQLRTTGSAPLIMAIIAEVVGSEAAEESY